MKFYNMSGASFFCYNCVDLSPCETVKFGFIIFPTVHFLLYMNLDFKRFFMCTEEDPVWPKRLRYMF